MDKIQLSKISTDAPDHLNKNEIQKELEKLTKRLGELQCLMLAEEKHSLIVILQGMDASGKDGIIRRIFNSCDPNALHIHGFKKPSEEEAAHDYLWRVHQVCPPKGVLQVFNRSHYEEILIVRVHGWIDEKTVSKRFSQINNFEKHLEENNTHIIKCFLHISPEAQLERLQERKTLREKMWKYNPVDWEERKLWDSYMSCYEDAINKCNNPEWNIIPSDKNWYRNYLVTKIIVEKMESLNMEYPII